MNILLTMPRGPRSAVFFPDEAVAGLRKIGDVRVNETKEPLTSDSLAGIIGDVDVCVTHWGSPKFTDDVIAAAPRLKLIAHSAGSVAHLVTETVYARGIKVCSANPVMARYVAEAALGYMLAALRLIPQHASSMWRGLAWDRRDLETESLFGKRVGLVGLGTVGGFLLDLLRPFGVQVRLYDPYLSADSRGANALAAHPEVELRSIEDVLSWAQIISMHASLTPETNHMLNAERLSLIGDDAVIINTARGAIFDERALERLLAERHQRVVLDVFEQEPLPTVSPLRMMENVILMPHLAGSPAREEMAYAVVDEVRRFAEGRPLQLEISLEKFKLMTSTEFITQRR